MYPFSLVNLSSFYALGPSTMLVTHVASATVGQTRQHDGIGGNNSEAGTSNTTLKLNRLHDANQTLVKNYSCEGPCGVDLTFGSKVSLDMYTLYIRCGVMRRMNLPYHSPRFSSLIALAMQMIGHGSSSPATSNKVMFEYYLWAKKSKSLATVHFRASKHEFEETHEHVAKIKAKHHVAPPTPWELGQHELVDTDKALEFYH
jgi:hypothetical protein